MRLNCLVGRWSNALCWIYRQCSPCLDRYFIKIHCFGFASMRHCISSLSPIRYNNHVEMRHPITVTERTIFVPPHNSLKSTMPKFGNVPLPKTPHHHRHTVSSIILFCQPQTTHEIIVPPLHLTPKFITTLPYP